MTDGQRKTLEDWLAVGVDWQSFRAAAYAALAEIDRLRAENAAHKADLDHAALLLHDVAEGYYDAEARGAAREREVWCRLLDTARKTTVNLETELALGDMERIIRSRGPLAPPLPAERLAARVAALEAALKPILARAGGVHPGVNPVVPRDLLEAARKALEESP